MSLFRRLTYLFLLILAYLPLSAQTTEQADSLVRLMSAQSGQLYEEKGVSYRKVIGPARFLHNNTYLVCDTALWNVNVNVIHAIGHVKIIQEETVLSGDNLDYIVDEDLAQFRGLVQLEDKDRNTLRTHFLDYNTKDSVAVFQNGGAMRDKDGQIIESRGGTYDSKINLFTFTDNVNMFSDSTLIRTNRLTYNTDTGMATFATPTDVWNSDKMLSSNGGWYDRAREVFFFRSNVHMMSDAQEGWADSLYYYRNIGDVELRGHVQVVDTTRNVAALGGRIYYNDSTSTVRLMRNAAVMIRQENEEKIDTTWVGADTLVYRSIMMCDVDSSEVALSKIRLKDLDSDPIFEFRKQAAEKAAKAREDAWQLSPDNPANAMIPRDVLSGLSVGDIEAVRKNYGAMSGSSDDDTEKKEETGKQDSQLLTRRDTNLDTELQKSAEPDEDNPVSLSDSLSVGNAIADSLALADVALDSLSIGDIQIDSLSIGDDIIPEVKDTTKVGFAWALGNVKIFREDMQVACDSLAYNDLDSLARFYKNPLIWNEANRQYSADSVVVAAKNQNLDRARLMSNAFIVIEEEKGLYDQIKSTEMMAYFDTTAALRRFDALGGASAMFYLKENERFATVNKVESKMLSANFVDGEIDRIYYYEDVQNDGYPLAQMTADDKTLKGFTWQIEKRPAGKDDITSHRMRSTERKQYEEHLRPKFPLSERYFPGYMKDVIAKIEKGEIARHNRAEAKTSAEGEPMNDPLLQADTLAAESFEVENILDQTETPVVNDTVSAPKPVIGEIVDADVADEPQQVDQKALKAQQRQQAKDAKTAAREARWAELDAKDAQKAEAKKQKALERKRKKTLKMLRKMDKADKKDADYLKKYEDRYKKKKARQNKSDKASESLEPARERVEGEIYTPWGVIPDEPDTTTEVR